MNISLERKVSADHSGFSEGFSIAKRILLDRQAYLRDLLTAWEGYWKNPSVSYTIFPWRTDLARKVCGRGFLLWTFSVSFFTVLSIPSHLVWTHTWVSCWGSLIPLPHLLDFLNTGMAFFFFNLRFEETYCHSALNNSPELLVIWYSQNPSCLCVP